VLLTTESGQPATGEEALLQFGEHGKLLLSLIQNEKEMSSIDSLLEQLGAEAGPTGVYHPQLRMPGTNTGRLSGGGGYNWQNPPKSPYMQAFVARPGYVLVSCDVAALENVVVTELSQDPTMLALYGPNAPKHQDGYLFFGSQLPVIGPVIRATGYDPFNPTKDSIAKAKKEAKKARDISKVLVLSSSYGAGPAKIHEALTLSGVDITLDECRTIHAGYWELCGGIKRWERELKRQWTDNKGWLLNGIGRPVCVDPDYMKDLVNRVVQSTGHDAFILFLMQTMQLRDRFEFYPWSADVHDAWYMEVREDQAEDFCKAVLDEVIPAWNDLLGGEIRLKAEPAIVTNLALDKLEGEPLEKAKEYAKAQVIRLRDQRSEGEAR
jgi:hypothetical protein